MIGLNGEVIKREHKPEDKFKFNDFVRTKKGTRILDTDFSEQLAVFKYYIDEEQTKATVVFQLNNGAHFEYILVAEQLEIEK